MSQHDASNCRRLRMEARQPLEFGTSLRAAEGRQGWFIMRNVSHGGFMGDSEIAHPVGTLVNLELPVIGRAEARVKWAKGNRLGCELLNGLNFREVFFLLLLSKVDEVERDKRKQEAA